MARVVRTLYITICMSGGGLLAVLTIPSGLRTIYLRLDPGAARVPGGVPDFSAPFSLAATALFGAITFGLLGLLFLSKVERAIARWRVMTNAERTTVFVAVLVGVGISIPFHMLTFSFGPWAVLGSMVLMFVLILLAYASLKSMEESLPWSRMGGRARTNTKILDTNVIIDGRIYDIAKSGFLEGRIYVPEFVLKELQLIADSHDATKRQKGRRGLDMLRHLQQDFELEIGGQDRHAGDESTAVDTRLVRLAKAIGASLVTNDFNLNKVAQVHGVRVLNVNDLALALRPQYHPNDVLSVEIEKEGTEPGQGVGYLEDGTMVVVEDGVSLIGERVEVRVSQVHQSKAGRMIFASLNGDVSQPHPQPTRKSPRT